MTLTVERWNGQDLQDAAYAAWFEDDALARTSREVMVRPPRAWGRHIGVELEPRSFRVFIEVMSGDMNAAGRQLSDWFAPGTVADLEVDEDGIAKKLEAVCLGFQRHAGSANVFQATLVAPDPRWRGKTPIVASRNLTANGQTLIVNNPGNSSVDDAVLTLRPFTSKPASAGSLHLWESIVAWRARRGHPNYPVEISEGWNHAAEAAASRSMTSGADVHVLVNGIDWPYWFGEHATTAANQAGTKVFVNLPFAPMIDATLLSTVTAILPGADGELEVRMGGTRGWPKTGGAFLLDDEVFTFAGTTEFNANGASALTGVRRGQRNTTAAAHTAGATLYFIQHRIQIVHGQTGATAPPSRPDLKPMLNLASATLSNERWEFVDFADETHTGRSAQWGRRVRAQDDQADKILAPSGSPAAALTFEYQSGGAVAGKRNANAWYIDLPCGTGSSAGNVASLTRALADTLGMWLYGVDNEGADVVLAKYAGALASGAVNVTAPTNPVYRLEAWAFNQIVASSPILTTTTGPARPRGWPVAALTTLTGTLTNHAQQFQTGNQPLDLLSLSVTVVESSVRDVLMYLSPDNSNVPAGFFQGSSAFATTAAAGVYAACGPIPYSSGGLDSFPLQPSTPYWWSLGDINASPTTALACIGQPYQRSERGGTVRTYETFEFRIMGRPGAFATSLERCDENCIADDGDQVTVDGVTVYLDTASVPYVSLRPRQTVYRYAPATIYNETTGQKLRLNAACKLHDEIVIDVAAGTAVNVDDEDGTALSIGAEGSGCNLEWSDPDAKLTLLPGDNVFQIAETGLAGLTFSVAAVPAWE